MGAFSGLSESLSGIFKKLRNKGKLTEKEIKETMREVRIALLEADVNLQVVKEFIATLSEKIQGEEILKSLTPDQTIIKLVNEELTNLMGKENRKLNVSSKGKTVILMCGLQGSGKTTMTGKLAYKLKKEGKNPLLVACDIYRPAAIKQLQVVGKGAGVPVFEMGQVPVVKIVKEALKEADKQNYDTLIIDTAGRLHIDQLLMQELKDIKNLTEPTEILLVVDAMTGQDAVNVAKTFNDEMEVTGVILTKLDGDTRGGAALSIRKVTGKPIKFVGIGERVSDLEPFYPDRMASRILGMGDILTLIEKAQNAYSENEAKKLEKKLREKSFTLQDYLDQLDKMKSMGNIKDMVNMIPGLSGKIKGNFEVDENRIKKVKSIILSMTGEERDKPEIIKSSRRKRIADGSGTTIQDVNQLLKQFDQMKQMMAQFSGKGKKGFRGLF